MRLYYAYNKRVKENTQTTNLGTRYPKDLLDAIKHLARRNERSFNSEVIFALRQYIAASMEAKAAPQGHK